MAGKRPDQHNIDPSEGRTTDKKSRPGEDAIELNRRQQAKQRGEQRDQPFPPDVPAPSEDVNRRIAREPRQA